MCFSKVVKLFEGMMAMFKGGAGLSAKHDSWNGNNIHTARMFTIFIGPGAQIGSRCNAESEEIWTVQIASSSTLPAPTKSCQEYIYSSRSAVV